MQDFAFALLGLLAGLPAGLYWAHRAARKREEAFRARQGELERELAGKSARLEAARQAIEDQKAFLEQSRKQFEDTFGNLSRQALRENSQFFLSQAEEKLKPLQEKLRELEEKRRTLEERRAKDLGSLKEHLDNLSATTESLGKQSHALETALRGSSQARGRWGELALRNIVELAGMTEHCDFEEQHTTTEGNRPDLVVRLPGGSRIPVDAKVPLSAYLEGLEADEPARREELFRRHAAQVRVHMQALAKRDYTQGLAGQINFTVMFLPGDPILSTAYRYNPDLQLEAMEKGILITTPVTLMAVLRTVGIYWQQEALAENAEAIGKAAKELYERIAIFQEHLSKVGAGLRSAVGNFNKAVGSLERSVLPSGRRLEELQVTDDLRRRMEGAEPVEILPRELPPAD
ncbi:MAG: DNA recombination protein RmuC [Planctomycetota bacterium]